MIIIKLQSEKLLDPRSGFNYACLSAISATTREHCHDFTEIFIVGKGEVTHAVNGVEDRLTAGDTVLIRPEDRHRYKNPGSGLEIINLAFSVGTLHECVKFYGGALSVDDLVRSELPLKTRIETDKVKELKNALDQAGGKHHETGAGEFKTIVLRLLAEFESTGQSIEESDKIPEWLLNLAETMREKDKFIAGLPKMRKLAPCSPEHLSRIFKQYFNESPIDFINRLKIERAATMLRDGDEKIFAVSMEAGFNNISNFYRCFRRHFHLSPARYRRQKRRRAIIPR